MKKLIFIACLFAACQKSTVAPTQTANVPTVPTMNVTNLGHGGFTSVSILSYPGANNVTLNGITFNIPGDSDVVTINYIANTQIWFSNAQAITIYQSHIYSKAGTVKFGVQKNKVDSI